MDNPRTHAEREAAQRADEAEPSHWQAHSFVLTDAYTGLPRYCRVVERTGTQHTLSCGHQTQSPSTLYHPGAPMPCLPCTQTYKAARGAPSHTHPCPICHHDRSCTCTVFVPGEPLECATCSNCRGW
jgi:hypothetical protein